MFAFPNCNYHDLCVCSIKLAPLLCVTVMLAMQQLNAYNIAIKQPTIKHIDRSINKDNLL